MKVKVEVFTSPTCPHCPAAVRLAKSVEERIPDVIKVVETSSGTHFGFQRMKKFNIMATPTIIISGPAIHDKIGFRGTPSKEKLLKAISEASGTAIDEIKRKVEQSNDVASEKVDKRAQSEVMSEGEKDGESGEKKKSIFSKLFSLFRKKR